MASTTSRREPYRLDPNLSTSHQLRGALKRAGWTLQESPTEVRLVKPGTHAAAEIIDRVLGPDETSGNESGEAAFELEYQLRDFLASNLGAVNIDGRRLRLYVDATGREGIEFQSATGPIDILAVDDKG